MSASQFHLINMRVAYEMIELRIEKELMLKIKMFLQKYVF